MKTKILAITGIVWVMLLSCDNDLVKYDQGDIEIYVEKGDAWLHDFPLFMGIKKKNPPQIAIWIEDLSGNYMATL